VSAIKDGGSISPILEYRRQVDVDTFTVDQAHPIGGLSIRDWFAGMALQGIIANLHCTPEVTFNQCSGRAYAMADAMLAAREGEHGFGVISVICSAWG